MPAVLQFALTVAVGVVSGVLSGMFGIGGAVVSTPAIRVLGASTFQAIGSTLPLILPSSISGSIRYNREHLIWGRIVLWTAAFGVPASVAGSRLSRAFPVVRADGTIGTVDHLRDQWWTLGVIGVAAGMLSGLLGIGGGILMVPAFSAWVGLPLKETIATSLACVGIFAVPGTITHAFQGDINWTFAIALAIGVIPGAQIGAHFTISSDDRTLRYTVGTALGIIAVIYAAGEINALF